MRKKRYVAIFILLALVLMICISGCQEEAALEEDDSREPTSSGSEPSVDPKDTNQDNKDGSIIDISSLEIGSIVMDPSWEWEFRTDWDYKVRDEEDVTAPVTWIIVAKDHYDSGITLLAENLIGYFPYDTSVLSSGIVAGQNHWGNSGTDTAIKGIRPWLNSNGIHDGEGFYNAFSQEFKSIVLDTSVPNREYENGENYSTSDKVFIPSSTELGDTVFEESFEIGRVYEYFLNADDDLRVARIKEDNYNRNYWLRNPITRGYRVIGSVYEYGFFTQEFAEHTGIGVRPVINIDGGTKVSSEPNENGIYVIKH